MSERRSVLKHALTVLVGQLAVISFGVTDTIVAGRYDPHALAALSIGSAIYISVYVARWGYYRPCYPCSQSYTEPSRIKKLVKYSIKASIFWDC